jgi:hypothetical protein
MVYIFIYRLQQFTFYIYISTDRPEDFPKKLEEQGIENAKP